jgi:3-hydroxyacyl-CoA dehydrogenase
MEPVAVIGAGLVGRAWAIVFARAGHPVALHDANAAALAPALDAIEASLADLHAHGLIREPATTVRQRIRGTTSLAEALRDVRHVQENVFESVDAKKAIFSAMDPLAPADAVLASSTSGIPASAFTADLKGRHRCLVAHPINPPSLIPLVEIVPAPWTAADVVVRTKSLLEKAGQVPIVVRREVPGFIVNRLQGALLNEAFRLVEDGYVSSGDLDKAVKDGLGLRWSFMGPFETIDLNAPGGLADYCARYGPLYHQIAKEATPRPWSKALIEEVAGERLAALPAEARPARQGWRDRLLTALVAHKRTQAEKEK